MMAHHVKVRISPDINMYIFVFNVYWYIKDNEGLSIPIEAFFVSHSSFYSEKKLKKS